MAAAAMTARTKPAPTPFALMGTAVAALGYRVIPVMPNSKSPGTCNMGAWKEMPAWNEWRDKAPTPINLKIWGAWENCNVGVILGNEVTPGWEVGALDFDTDDPDDVERIESSIPPSTVQKRGRRGFTAFYLFPTGTKGRRFKRGSETIFEILTGNGTRQTVIPPSIHPDTGQPYTWLTTDTLATVPADDLVKLDADALARLIDTVESIPGVDTRAESPPFIGDDEAGASPHSALNTAGLRNLGAWVPALGLAKLTTTSSGFKAIPSWRANRNGWSDDQRKPSLGFSARGIRDFSADKPHSPLDIVMMANGLDLPGAFLWLSAKLGRVVDDDGEWPEMEAAMAAAKPAKPANGNEPPESEAQPETAFANEPLPDHDPETGEIHAAPFGTPKPRSPLLKWFGASAPIQPRWLVRGVFPEKGVAIIAGQHGAGKTFVVLDLAASVITGEDFSGAQVCRTGGVLFLAAEGENEIDARMLAIVHGKLNGPQPVVDVAKWFRDHGPEPKNMDGLFVELKPLSPMPFARQVLDVPRLTEAGVLLKLRPIVKAAAEEMAEHFGGIPLALIVVDTLAAAAGFEDENSASETQRTMNVLAQLSRETGALVVVVDHFGKAAETGVRGSSAKGAAADAILAILAERSATGVVSDRRMAVQKLRGGATGAVKPFELVAADIDGFGSENCFVRWKDREVPAEEDEAVVMAEADTGVALMKAMVGDPAGTQQKWAADIGKAKATVGKNLAALKKERLVESVLGRWNVTPKGQLEIAKRG